MTCKMKIGDVKIAFTHTAAAFNLMIKVKVMRLIA